MLLMIEITLVLVALVAAGVIGLVGASVTPGLIAAIGVGALLLGLAVGVPTGLWYHVILYRCVSAKIALPPTWWLSPAALHRHLTPAETRRISPWNRVGGLGFVLCLVGGLAAIAGLLLGR
jgi:hypothetical protein